MKDYHFTRVLSILSRLQQNTNLSLGEQRELVRFAQFIIDCYTDLMGGSRE